MQRGCISLGDIQCDNCHQAIPYLGHYLATNEEEKGEEGNAPTLRYCLDCCLTEGIARYTEERRKQTLTFFSERL
ncbi:hypothetical protein ACFLU4_05695 [Chloroflexota bacterium]